MKILVTIEQKTGIPAKTVVGTLAVALILTAVGFSYRNITLPVHQQQIKEVKADTKSLLQKDSAKTLQFEIIKYNVAQIATNQEDLKEDFKELKTDIKADMTELKTLVRQLARGNGIIVGN